MHVVAQTVQSHAQVRADVDSRKKLLPKDYFCRYKKERLEEVVREHRRKFGIQSVSGPSPFRLQQQQQQFGLRRS